MESDDQPTFVSGMAVYDMQVRGIDDRVRHFFMSPEGVWQFTHELTVEINRMRVWANEQGAADPSLDDTDLPFE